jgi:AraC family transcriptional regulator of arabinose operon
MDDLVAARLARAKYLLQSGDMTVTQIAPLSGYANAHHFIRQCKKVTGLAPTGLRNAGR